MHVAVLLLGLQRDCLQCMRKPLLGLSTKPRSEVSADECTLEDSVERGEDDEREAGKKAVTVCAYFLCSGGAAAISQVGHGGRGGHTLPQRAEAGEDVQAKDTPTWKDRQPEST
jgi:hypothetical protein